MKQLLYIACWTIVVSYEYDEFGSVECRMSNVIGKRLEPCQQSLQRLSDIALCARKGKKNEGQSDMGENIGAYRKFPQYLLVKQETSALCHVQKGRPNRD